MKTSSVIRRDMHKLGKWLHKWFGANRGTHWSVAGSVAVIVFGSYLIYSNRNRDAAAAAATTAAGQTRVSTASAPLD